MLGESHAPEIARGLRTEEEGLAQLGQLRLDAVPVGPDARQDTWPVVQAGPFYAPIVQGEAERPHQVELSTRGQTAAARIPRVPVDLRLHQHHVQFSYYRQNISDLILVNEVPPSSGFEAAFINGGKMRTQGYEAALGVTPFRRKNFSWTSRVNFYRTFSEITQLDVDPFTTGGFALSLGEFEIAEDKSPNTIVGLDEQGNKVDVGNETPDFQISFNNNFTFLRNFELSFLWDWKQGGDVINLGRLITDSGGTSDDQDTPEGQARVNGTATSRYVEDGSYLKLRELSLSYSVPGSIVNHLFAGQISYLRFGFAARNLLMFTGYDGPNSRRGRMSRRVVC